MFNNLILYCYHILIYVHIYILISNYCLLIWYYFFLVFLFVACKSSIPNQTYFSFICYLKIKKDSFLLLVLSFAKM